ncbi:MAG: hypothetical protein HXK98_00630 [Candidatus Nanogingivalaceae bacterium]|nr:hypothetical protein [Candidatus Nanogingivalaceae bacterium]
MIFAVFAVVVTMFGFVAFTGAPYVPSRRRDLQRAFNELYQLKEADSLVDIGSGDGVVLREASRRGARAIGYELHPLLVLLSRWLSRGDKKVSVRLANFWRTPLPDDTTVVYLFGDGRDIAKMVQYLQCQTNRIGRDIWLISYGFEAADLELKRTVGAHNLYLLRPER